MVKSGLHKVLQQPFSEMETWGLKLRLRLLKLLSTVILCGKHLTYTLNNMGHLLSSRKQRHVGEKQRTQNTYSKQFWNSIWQKCLSLWKEMNLDVVIPQNTFKKKFSFCMLGLIWQFPLCEQKVEAFQNTTEAGTQKSVSINTHANLF